MGEVGVEVTVVVTRTVSCSCAWVSERKSRQSQSMRIHLDVLNMENMILVVNQ